MLPLLSRTHQALGGWHLTRRRLPIPSLQSVGRAWLRGSTLRGELSRMDDVTVVIGTRNRADSRLVNALKSIRAQTHPDHLVRIAVVDYGSEPESAGRTEQLCREFVADYVRVQGDAVWSRSRCLNVGLRRADTKYVMTSDADILLSPSYLADAVSVLREAPLSVVCSPMLDLPEESADVLERASREQQPLQLDAWREWCRPRFGWQMHPSVCVAFAALYRAVRGYDEYYEVWGAEDDDLIRRFSYLGVETRAVGADSFYLHQWHSEVDRRGQGAWNPQTWDEQVERNRAHFAASHSILRNDRHWGSPG